MAFASGCNHPSFALPWRTLLPYLVALHLLHPGSAQLTVVAPSLRVTANVGQDVVLRCHLCPCKDGWRSDIRWIQHRSSGIVHHYRNGQDLDQMEEYKGRTELLRDGLSDGNLDLRITAVSSSDGGSYSCAVQDDDGYAEAVVNLEVSDPFSQIVHPWKVALGVIVTILVGSFVIIAFLYRKKAAQSRELKRKDAMLGLSAANLKKLASKLNENADKVENSNSDLKKDCEEMGSGIIDLKELAEELEEHSEEMEPWHAMLKSSAIEQKKLVTELEEHCEQMVRRNVRLEEKTDEVENWNSELKKDCEEMGSGVANLKILFAELMENYRQIWKKNAIMKRLAAKLGRQTKELEKQHSRFYRHFQNMDSRAVKQKKMVTELEEHCEWMERRNAKLEAAAVKVGHKAKESEKQKSELKERHEEMAQQTEAVVVDTEEAEKPSEEWD